MIMCTFERRLQERLLLEAKRRIVLGWTAFGKVYNIMRSPKSTIGIKRKLFIEYVLLVMTYASETQALNTIIVENLAVAQCKME